MEDRAGAVAVSSHGTAVAVSSREVVARDHTVVATMRMTGTSRKTVVAVTSHMTVAVMEHTIVVADHTIVAATSCKTVAATKHTVVAAGTHTTIVAMKHTIVVADHTTVTVSCMTAAAWRHTWTTAMEGH